MKLNSRKEGERSAASFFLKVAPAALLITCLVGVGLYYALQVYMLSKAEKSIQDVMLEHRGIHRYVQQYSHPALFSLQEDGQVPTDFYSPELLSSSFMMRNVHSFFNEERGKLGLPPIYYKMAALNPRNPVNKADALESRLIEMFNKDRSLTHYNEVIEVDGQKYLYYAVPFLTNNSACLKCHGEREAAPIQLQQRYPGLGGFNEELGQIRAIEFVRAPLQSQLQSLQMVFAAILSGFVAFMVLVLFNRRLRSMVHLRTRNLESELAERRRAEAALAERESFLKTLVESSLDAIVTTDVDRNITSCNSAFLSMYGYLRQEVLGASVRMIHSSFDSFEKWKQVILPELNTQGYWKGEWEFRRKDGAMLPVEVVISAHRGAQGALIGYVAIHRDVSDRRRAERDLRESEEKFRGILDTMTSGIILVDARGIINFANRKMASMFGCTMEQLIGSSYLSRTHSSEAVEAEQKMLQLMGDGIDHVFLERLYLKQDGGTFWGQLSGRRLLHADGSFWALLGVIHDVTEQKAAREQRALLESQLRQAQKMEAIGTLAGGIAHDFNNILAAIMGYAEMAYEDALTGKIDPADIKQVLASAERARQLVRQILAFSRKNEPDLKISDLNKLVAATRDILGRTLPKMIKIETHLTEKIPPVLADPVQLEQVMLNLAANAADAMSEGGALTLETSVEELDQEYCNRHLEVRPGVYAVFSVSDTGQGMDAVTREHIFEPFFTTKEIGKGTGLGLSSSYGIVKNHGGHIHCYSEKGIGTTFRIYLPAYESPRAEPTSESGAADDDSLRGTETILLVDDEKSLRLLGGRNLESMGYRVLTAASGEEAIEVYGRQEPKPDLVIMDLGMPGMGGHKAMKSLLAIDPQAKVVIASGYSPQGRAKDALEDGAVGYVAKPYRRGDLLGTVRKVLDQR